MGQCLDRAGDAPGARASFAAGLKLDRGHADLAVALADLLAAQHEPAQAEAVLRAALAANRRSVALIVRLAAALTQAGRAAEALTLLARPAAGTAPDHAVLAAQADAFKAANQPARAQAAQERAVRLFPGSAVAHHNLAATHGDAGRYADAASHAARALARGGDAPQTWLVYARALLGAGKLDQSEQAFAKAIDRAPLYMEAHRELAQLIWMRHADADAALAPLDKASRAQPGYPPYLALRAKILQHAGRLGEADAVLRQAVRANPEDSGLCLAAAELAARAGDPVAAVDLATQAARLRGQDAISRKALFCACVAAGETARAGALAAQLVAEHPTDQNVLAYQALAWRLAGDPRYAEIHDYPTMVRAWRMDVPDGWASLAAYLADLTEALGGLHPFRSHPLDQSVRHGSQAGHLLGSSHPVIRSFFQAVDGPIRRHLAALGHGTDPLRARNTGSWRFDGAWSVRLRPGGFHADHVHPDGWLSSACYIAVPDTPAEGRAAWIKFGEPGIPTQPALAAEHFVRPEPGLLVLFPSYMWHGTVPFTAGGERLSVAFDLVP